MTMERAKRQLSSREERSRVRFYEELPRDVIRGAIFNDHLQRGVWDNRLKRWLLDKEYVIRNAGLFATGAWDGEQRRMQPPSMHRGIVLRMLTVPWGPLY